MTGIDHIIEMQLTGPLVEDWTAAFERAIKESIAVWSVDHFNLDLGKVSTDWDQLNAPTFRAHIVTTDVIFSESVAQNLEAQIDHIRSVIRANLGNRQTRNSVHNRIAALVPRWLSRPNILALLTASPFAHDWSFIADEIGRRVYRAFRTLLPISASDEWVLMNQFLLAEYFRQCRHKHPSQVRHELDDARKGILSVRGTLQNTITKITTLGVEGDMIPISQFSGGINVLHPQISDLIEVVARESIETANQNGVMRRIVGDHHHSEQPEAVRSGQTSMAAVQSARELAYLRYERSILAYMALAAIEQLLRTLATHKMGSSFHLKAGNVPKGIPRWVSDLGLPPDLVNRILVLFDSARGNVRNRIMHGVFVLTTTKRLRDNLSVTGLENSHPAEISPDNYTPANIAHLALECLRDLDAQLVNVTLTDSDYAWTNSCQLTTDEIIFCRSLAGGLIPNADQSNFYEIDNRRIELSEYFRAVMPGLGQFFRLGYICVIQSHSSNTLPLLHGLGLVFEPIYRLTCHLIGLEVLQKPDKLTNTLHFQYHMLDEDGLCQEKYLNRLVQHCKVTSRDEAKRILRLAVKARNALAHGAVVRFDEPTSDGIKRLLAEAIQLLVEAGRHHMILEAAWYNWKDIHGFQDGHHLDDWQTGESAIRGIISDLGRIPHV